MKTIVMLFALLLPVLGGCATAQVEEESDTARRFFAALRTLKHRELVKVIPQIVRAGEPASAYADIIARANETREKRDSRVYRFWPRDERPQGEFDYWVEIIVDKKTDTIKHAHPNKYIL